LQNKTLHLSFWLVSSATALLFILARADFSWNRQARTPLFQLPAGKTFGSQSPENYHDASSCPKQPGFLLLNNSTAAEFDREKKLTKLSLSDSQTDMH